MTSTRKYKIPKGLALQVAGDNQLRKALDTFIVMKAIVDGGRFANTIAQRKGLAMECRVHVKTFNSRLQRLEAEQLVTITTETVTLASWNALTDQYGLSGRFNYVETAERIEYVLLAKLIHEQKTRCKITHKNKLKRDPIIRYALHNATAQERPRSDDVLNSQVHCFVTEGKDYSADDRYILSLFQFRADFDCSYRRYSQLLGYSSKGGFAYMKRKLQRLKLISVQSRRGTLATGHTTTSSRKTMLGQAPYLPVQNRPVLIMPDKIEVLI